MEQFRECKKGEKVSFVREPMWTDSENYRLKKGKMVAHFFSFNSNVPDTPP